MLNKKACIIIAVAVILVLACVIFCSVYFTVKIDVNKKIATFFQADGDLEYIDMTIGQSINIENSDTKEFITHYLKDRKFTHTLFNLNGVKGNNSISKGNQFIVLCQNYININGKWYKADANIATEIDRKIDEVTSGRQNAQ